MVNRPSPQQRSTASASLWIWNRAGTSSGRGQSTCHQSGSGIAVAGKKPSSTLSLPRTSLDPYEASGEASLIQVNQVSFPCRLSMIALGHSPRAGEWRHSARPRSSGLVEGRPAAATTRRAEMRTLDLIDLLAELPKRRPPTTTRSKVRPTTLPGARGRLRQRDHPSGGDVLHARRIAAEHIPDRGRIPSPTACGAYPARIQRVGNAFQRVDARRADRIDDG